MATGRANPKQTVTTAAWTGKWTRGYLFKNAVLENKICFLRLVDTLFPPNKANSWAKRGNSALISRLFLKNYKDCQWNEIYYRKKNGYCDTITSVH